jgi:chromosome segregation ATPase
MDDCVRKIVQEELRGSMPDFAEECARKTVELLKSHKRDRDDLEQTRARLQEQQEELESKRKKLREDVRQFEDEKAAFERRVHALDKLERKLNHNGDAEEIAQLRERVNDEDPPSLLSFEFSDE